MSKFKVGDTVIRVGGSKPLGKVGYIHQSSGPVTVVDKKGNTIITTFPEYLELCEELPPAPAGVTYCGQNVTGNRRILRVDPATSGDALMLRLSNPYGAAVNMLVEPDDALDLAHDIYRMAMELKRQQKKGQ